MVWRERGRGRGCEEGEGVRRERVGRKRGRREEV